MSLGHRMHYRVKTYPSGKRVRQALIGDRVVETKSMPTKQTKSRKRLSRARRKIGLR